jgi:hypothetical protein
LNSVGNLGFSNREVPVAGLDGSPSAADPNNPPGHNTKLERPNKKDGTVDNRFKERSIITASPGKSVGAARGAIIIDAINTAWVSADFISTLYEREKISEHVDLLQKAILDVNDALKMNMIPENMQNEEALSDILNYVFQGESYLKDKEGYENIGKNAEIVGKKIVEHISKKREEN